MSVQCRLVLVGILAFSGCASAPKQPAESPALPVASTSAAPNSSAAANTASAPSSSAPATTSAAAVASETEGATAGGAAVAKTESIPIIEASTLADPNPVTCRDLLIPGSNVMRTHCMTRNDWKVFEEAQRIWARDMLLRMQGFKR